MYFQIPFKKKEEGNCPQSRDSIKTSPRPKSGSRPNDDPVQKKMQTLPGCCFFPQEFPPTAQFTYIYILVHLRIYTPNTFLLYSATPLL